MSIKKVSVSEAAEFFGVSKEAIHNRIRRGSLEVALVDGIKMVVIDTNAQTKSVKRQTAQKSSASNDERYYKLLQEQNEKLQARVEMLESETRTLRDQKELMLIEERKKIEQIYKEKDEQLKNLLSTLSSQFMLMQPKEEQIEVIAEPETLEVEIEEQRGDSIISLNKYLKKENYSKKRREKIKKTFQKRVKKEERVIKIDDKIYLDFVKYDYSDLL